MSPSELGWLLLAATSAGALVGALATLMPYRRKRGGPATTQSPPLPKNAVRDQEKPRCQPES